MNNQNNDLLTHLKTVPVIPVITVQNLQKARCLAAALVQGGLHVLEVTLRTDCALAAITQMASVEGAFVGAGTVRSAADVKAAQEAGANFAVSPGATEAILQTAVQNRLPLLPGAATASEMMALSDRGFRFQKFFPAQASGGAAALKSFADPLPDITFCPTGGIGLHNATDYLSLPNVICVGGSWVCPKDLIEDENWTAIERLAAETYALRL